MRNFIVTKNIMEETINKAMNEVKQKNPVLRPSGQIYRNEETDLDILENEIVKYLVETVKVDGSKVAEHRELKFDGFCIQDNMFPLLRTGAGYTGTRVTRNDSAKERGCVGSLDTNYIEISLIPFVPYSIYKAKGVAYREDKFKEKFSEEELYRMYKLTQSIVSDCINEDEMVELIKIASKDDIIREFFWDINFLYSKYSNKRNKLYKIPNVLGIPAIEDNIFELKSKKALIIAIFKGLLVDPFIKMLTIINRTKTEHVPYMAITRSIHTFRLIVEIDAAIDLDFAISYDDGTIIYPKITYINERK